MSNEQPITVQPQSETYNAEPLKKAGSAIYRFGRKHWVVIFLLVIFLLAYNMRLSGFVNADGGYRWPYLRNIDSYALMHQMQLIIDNNGVMPSYDPLLLAPEGVNITPQPFPYQYLGAYGYMLFHMFNPALQLWQFLIYLPAFLAALMVIPAYYIGKTLYDKKAGIIAAFLIVFMPAITARTLAADPDTDAIAMLLTLASMAMFLVAYKSITKDKYTKKNVIYAVLSGIVLSIYAYTWAGSWHIPLLITTFVVLKLVLDFILSKGNIMARLKQVWIDSKHLVYTFVILFLTFTALMSVFFGPMYVVDTVFGTPIGMLGLGGHGNTLTSEEGRQFPNVQVSVAELQSGGDIGSVAQRVGSIFFILTFVFALPYLILSYITTRKHLDTALLIIIWSIGTLMAAVTAIRFESILAPPIVIGSAIIISKVWRLALGEDDKILQ